jgi:hypothetical protein
MEMGMKQGVFARLGLGLAYALQGNTAQSRAVDQVFKVWNDADRDILILRRGEVRVCQAQVTAN